MKVKRLIVISCWAGIGFCFSGCTQQPAPGRAEKSRKTTYTQAEVEALKADGVSDAEIKNMGISIVD